MRALRYSVIIKREVSKKDKLSIFKTVFVPIFIYDNESLGNDQKIAITSASVRNEDFTMNRRSYTI